MEGSVVKKFGERFITVAALGCLLALWALPASAYYPPLHATVTVEAGNVGVTYRVYDPKLQKDVTYTQKYWENTVVDCKQDNGVIAWVFHHPIGNYYLILLRL